MNDKEIAAAIIDFCMEERVFSQFCTYMGDYNRVEDRWRPNVRTIQLVRHAMNFTDKKATVTKLRKLTLPLQKGKSYLLRKGSRVTIGWVSSLSSICEVIGEQGFCVAEVNRLTGKASWSVGEQFDVVEDAE